MTIGQTITETIIQISTFVSCLLSIKQESVKKYYLYCDGKDQVRIYWQNLYSTQSTTTAADTTVCSL